MNKAWADLRRQGPDPLVAVALSAVWPGLGHFGHNNARALLLTNLTLAAGVVGVGSCRNTQPGYPTHLEPDPFVAAGTDRRHALHPGLSDSGSSRRVPNSGGSLRYRQRGLGPAGRNPSDAGGGSGDHGCASCDHDPFRPSAVGPADSGL